MKHEKTNAMRLLEAKGIPYTEHMYEHAKNDPVDGVHVQAAAKERTEYMKHEKTNAMRLLEAKGIPYTEHMYEHAKNDPVDGVHVAHMLGEPVERVYKTLVAQANTKEYLVFMIPVDQELDFKKCARAAGVKNTEMIHLKDLTKITGYIRGGCSPLLVFMIPVDQELDFKKCARAAGVKNTEMIHLKDLTKITGYIRGGCSPLGMKKQFRTFAQEDAILYDTIFFSGGKIGLQIEADPNDVAKVIPLEFADLVRSA